MTRRRRTARAVAALGALACSLTWMLGLTGTAAAGPIPSASAGDRPAVSLGTVGAVGAGLQLELTSMTPTVGSVGSGLQLTGRIVTEPGASTPATTLVRIWRGPSAVTRDRVAEWSTGTSVPTGAPLASVAVTGASFTLSIDHAVMDAAARSSLGSRALGAIPLALVATPGGTHPAAVDRAGLTALHTFLPWQARKEYEPIALAFLAPVTIGADPRLFDTDPSIRATGWQEQLAPQSTLSRMVAATADLPVAWAVDPVLLDPAGAGVTSPGGPSTPGADEPTTAPSPSTTSGPTSSPTATATSDPATSTSSPPAGGPTGAPTEPPTEPPVQQPSTPSELVARSDFASRLAATITDPARPKTAYALPWGDLDVAAFADLAPDNAAARRLVERAAPMAARLGRSAAQVPTIAWPADGSLAGSRAADLTTLWGSTGPALTIAAASSAASDPDVTESRTAGARTASGAALLWDERLSSTVAEPASGAALTAAFLADTAAVVNERPGTAGRGFLIAIPRGTDLDPGTIHTLFAGLGQTPWLTIASPTDLIAPAGAAAITTATPTWGVGGQAVLTGPLIGDLDRQRTAAQQVASLLSDNPATTAIWNEAIDEVTSTRWRTDPNGFDTMTANAAAISADLTAGISVAPGTTNFLADDGVLTVTVVNDLDVALTGARLRLQPLDPRMRIDGDPGPIDIGAHSKATVRVHAIAVAAGLVPINATVTTADGTPVGKAAELTVRANPPGAWPYVAAGVLAGLILVAGIVRTIRGRRRKHIAGLG